jgi:hypothetical protein
MLLGLKRFIHVTNYDFKGFLKILENELNKHQENEKITNID